MKTKKIIGEYADDKEHKNIRNGTFDEEEVLIHLKHYLPAQSPLKDFIHHNTLHAFQDKDFHSGINQAATIFGYKVYLQLNEFRELYHRGEISNERLEKVIIERKGIIDLDYWKNLATITSQDFGSEPRIGELKKVWKDLYKINLEKIVHPILFRTVSNYLDQGIAIRQFPVTNKGLIGALREIVKNSFANYFRSKRVTDLLLHTQCKIEQLLHILIGDESLYEHYLFDQQFMHPGWSGMVSSIEDNSQTLLDQRKITLHDFIALELLFEIDALDMKFGLNWAPLGHKLKEKPAKLFGKVNRSNLSDVYAIWQEAYEWSYYDHVLAGILHNPVHKVEQDTKKFDALFCIDDRECSFRRHLESVMPGCKTFGIPGFFNVEFYYQPEHGKFLTKVCPAPLNPKFLVKELNTKEKRDSDAHFRRHSNSLLFGWMISQTLGFWSAVKLFWNIFRPSISPATSYSFRHMDKNATLSIENKNLEDRSHGLQIGFTHLEMSDRVEGLLKSIGLLDNIGPIVYVIGHGASSVNNTHYAGYDCGACSGRPGSVNARVISFMANHKKVREILTQRGLPIPNSVQFIGAMHDTTRDEIQFYDEDLLSPKNLELHKTNVQSFEKALSLNAKERSRRFVLMKNNKSPELVHEKVKLRSVSLFEPRPELNHATNTLCVIGRRGLTDHLFLDRRAFMNSYDYSSDRNGTYLLSIMNAVAPVCGGINLEYYFSRVDNYKLGAGTKLPHNVMGLIGVANGADGDLRPGLPSQMIEVHDPMRLLIIAEHFPEVVLKALKTNETTYKWFVNNWINLVVINPESKELFRFIDGEFRSYQPSKEFLKVVDDMTPIFEQESENLPVYLISDKK